MKVLRDLHVQLFCLASEYENFRHLGFEQTNNATSTQSIRMEHATVDEPLLCTVIALADAGTVLLGYVSDTKNSRTWALAADGRSSALVPCDPRHRQPIVKASGDGTVQDLPTLVEFLIVAKAAKEKLGLEPYGDAQGGLL